MGLFRKKCTPKDLGILLAEFTFMMVESNSLRKDLSESDIGSVNFQNLSTKENRTFDWEDLFLRMFCTIDKCRELIDNRDSFKIVWDAYHGKVYSVLESKGFPEVGQLDDILNDRYRQYKAALQTTADTGKFEKLAQVVIQNLLPSSFHENALCQIAIAIHIAAVGKGVRELLTIIN